MQQVIEVGLVLAAAAAAAANAACVPERAGLKRETPSRAETTPPRTTLHTLGTASDVILQCRHFLHLISLFNRLIRWHTSTAVFIHLTGLFSIILIKGHHPKRPEI